MLTIFERIPDFFIERYNEELCVWGRNFQALGCIKSIVLKEGALSDPSPDPEQGAQLLRVRLLARFEWLRQRMTVTPYSDADEMLIAKHCEKLQKRKQGPRMFTPEPPRPWLPFMPSIKYRK
jgi:hypothetical protein